MSATTMDEAPVDAESTDKPAPVEGLFDALRLFMRYPTPWMIFGTAAVCSVARLIMGGLGWVDFAIAAAIFAFWPVQEWLIHVFILHFKPFDLFGRRVDLHLANEHRKHHRRPWIIPKIFVPIRAVIVGVTLVVPLLVWAGYAFGQLPYVLTALGFFFLLGSVYEWTHFLVHTAYKPKSAFYKRLWRNHRLHHFKNENYYYGVTRLEGDILLGTAPEPKSIEKSVTVRSIV